MVHVVMYKLQLIIYIFFKILVRLACVMLKIYQKYTRSTSSKKYQSSFLVNPHIKVYISVQLHCYYLFDCLYNKLYYD